MTPVTLCLAIVTCPCDRFEDNLRTCMDLIHTAAQKGADMVIFPMQDVLGLGAEDRMNTPSVTHGNWRWRLTVSELTDDVRSTLSAMTRTYGRAPR